MRKFFYFVIFFSVSVFLVLSSCSKVDQNTNKSINLFVSSILPPELNNTSEIERSQFEKIESTESFNLTLNLSKMTVKILSGDKVVYSYSTSFSKNINFSTDEITSGNYTLKVEIYDVSNKLVILGEVDVELTYGDNFITIQTKFANGTLNLIITNQLIEEFELSEFEISGYLESSDLSFYYNQTDFSSVTELYPGVWDVTFVATLTNKNDLNNKRKVVKTFSFELYPAELKEIQILINDVTVIEINNLILPYIDPVRALSAEYSRSENSLLLKWDYDQPANFKIYKKVGNYYSYIGETSEHSFKIVDINKNEYLYYVNAIYNGKESGLTEINVFNDFYKLNIVDHKYFNLNKSSDIFIYNNYAFVSRVGEGLSVIDISNPNIPNVLNNYKNFGSVYDVFIKENYAYLACYSRLKIVDITDIMNPIEIGHFDAERVTKVIVSGNYAYINYEDKDILIIDITDPTEPRRIASIYLSYSIKGIFISGDYLFVARGSNGLTIIDISDPFYPKTLVNYDTPGYVEDIYISGSYAYVADGSNGLLILDISNIPNIQKIGSYDTLGYAQSVFVEGNYAYVADGSNGLVIIDITNPINPVKVKRFTTTGNAYKVYLLNSFAYIAEGAGGIEIIDVKDPINPKFIKHLNLMQSNEVFFKENYLYVTDELNGLMIFEVIDPFNTKLVSWLNVSGLSRGVFVEGNYAYIANDSNGMLIVDISNPASPINIGNFDTIGKVYDVFVIGSHAYLADYNNGVTVLNISDPTNIQEIGNFDTSGYAYKLYVSGNYAYVADGSNGLLILDISKAIPELIGSFDTSGTAFGVYLLGNYAYVADGSNGLVIIDVSNPFSPKKVGNFDTSGIAYDVFVLGNFAYVADDENGLLVVNISDPTNPKQYGYIDTSGNTLGIYAYEDYAYVADYNNGLLIIDIYDFVN